MQVTDVRVRLTDGNNKRKAVASVTFDSEFVVHEISVIEGTTGLFISMPSRRSAAGDYRDISHPITSECREKIKDAVIAEYEKLLEQ